MISHARSSSQICRQHLVSPQPSNLQRARTSTSVSNRPEFCVKVHFFVCKQTLFKPEERNQFVHNFFLSTLVKLHSHSHHTEHSGEMEFFFPRSIKSSKLKLTFNKLFFYVYGLVPPCFKKASLFHTYLQQSNCYISYTFSKI